MKAADVAFASPALLRLIEGTGLIGTWGWSFASNEQFWSAGLYRILGFRPGGVRASYALLRDLAHREDREALETAAEIVQGGSIRDRTFRILRPDGSPRTLSCRGEVYHDPDGRPRAACGLVLDVTDRSLLTALQAAERRRRRRIFDRTRSFMFTLSVDGVFGFPEELFDLTGLPPGEVADDAFVTICPEEREHWRGLSIVARTAGLAHASTPLAPLAGGGSARFRVVTVPVRDEGGVIREWSSITLPVGASGFDVADAALRGLEQAVRGPHLRAARAILGWSVADLAAASGLTIHTVRQTEEDAERVVPRIRHIAVAALRRGGVRFAYLDDGTVAVARA